MTTPSPIPSIQTVQQLGRCIFHEDFIPVALREFILLGMRNRGWPLRTVPSEGMPIKARLDSGRWLADCPDGCRGAELVSLQDPVFLCLSCGSNGILYSVEFPRLRRAIELELSKRNTPAGWSWVPGETLPMLRKETVRLIELGLA